MLELLDCGIVGLSVMGRSLALNLCDHGYRVGGFNRSSAVTEEMLRRWPHEHFTPFYDLRTLVEALRRPRRILLMVKAGEAVDLMLEKLLPLLESGDTVLDCGNSHFADTARRANQAREQGIHYFGVGVSGGEEGARHGPAIMPGGDAAIYDAQLKSMLEAVAAKAPDGSPCCAYMGPEGAGHFVKMVHNGIEYADMQLIVEAYLLLKQVGGLDNRAMSDLFAQWNTGELQSYLVEITADILREPDDLASGELLDKIEDSAGQKGTGRWTAVEALRLGVDVSMIASAGGARLLSSNLALREATAKLLPGPALAPTEDVAAFAEGVRQALYAAKILAYAQGFALLKSAFAAYGWPGRMEKIAGVFRAGCIIRAAFLDDIMAAYREEPELTHLTHAPFFAGKLVEYQPALRSAAVSAIKNGLPAFVFSNAVGYYDALRGTPMGANLLQAQRDYFGAHTYRRTDREGCFHHEWGRNDGQ